MSLLALGALWALELGWGRSYQSFRFTATDGLLSFFLFLSVFSFLFSPYQHASLRSLIGLVTSSLLYWYLVNHRSRRGVHLFLVAVVILGAFQAVLIWYELVFIGGGRHGGTFFNPNFAASLLAAATVVALGMAIFPGGRSRASRTAAAAAALIMSGAVLATQSRGGGLALVAGVAILLAGRSMKLAVGLIAGVSAGIATIPNPLMERLGTISQDVYAYERLSIWKSAVQMMLDHPWFGVGLGQFEYFSPRYAFPVDAHWARFGRIAHTPHNEYLHAGAELGIPGIILVLALIATVTVAALRAVLRSEGGDRDTLSILSAVAAVTLVHSLVDFPLHAPPLVILLVASAAGLRVFGAEGNAWVVEFRFRKLYALAVAVLALYLAFLAARPVVAFSYYLGGIGAPRDLLREKRALELAERKEVSNATSIAFLEKAVALDPGNATYHNALGSRYFKYYFTEDDGKLRDKALFHGNFAMELNPNNHRFAYGLGQAMESLYRRYGEERFLRMAAEKYRQARSLAPNYYASVEKVAFIEEEIGDLAAAERGLRRVVSLEPNYIRGWYNLAVFMAKQGRVEEAMAAISEAESVPSRVRTRPRTDYEKNLLDFDGSLLAELRERLSAAEKGADAE